MTIRCHRILMKKIYVIDTNILLHNPNALLLFEDNDIIIPDVVIDELDNHKRTPGEIGANARQASRMLDGFRQDKKNGNLISGYTLPSGGQLKIEMNCTNIKMPSFWKDSSNLRILRVCKGLKNDNPQKDVILVTNNSFLRIKASVLGILSEELTSERAPSPEDLFQGRRIAFASEDAINRLYSNETVSPSELKYYSDNGKEIKMPDLKIHEYLLIKNELNPEQTVLCIYDEKIKKLRHPDSGVYGIKPKNVGQKFLIDALARPANEAPLVIVKGPAGTGKTLLALAAGLEATIEKGEYRRVLYLRGNTKLDEDIGFLPGTETEKMDWALRPVRDNLEIILNYNYKQQKTNKKQARYAYNDFAEDKPDNFSEKDIQDKCDEFFDRGYINIEAIAHMRGRSIAGTFVIIDEAQNLTPKQVRTLLSRCAKDTKIILLGDPYQIDHPYLDFRTNGLCYAADRMAGSPTTYQTTMLDSECERSELSVEVYNRMTEH